MQTPPDAIASYETSIDSAASPEAVHDLVSDGTRMGEWMADTLAAIRERAEV